MSLARIRALKTQIYSTSFAKYINLIAKQLIIASIIKEAALISLCYITGFCDFHVNEHMIHLCMCYNEGSYNKKGLLMQYTLKDGYKLYYDISNPRLVPNKNGSLKELPSLVVLHGGPGYDHTPYLECFGQVQTYAQVIFIDMLGNGRSSHADQSKWNYERWTSDLHELFIGLGIEKPILFGHSWGGTVALEYAIRYSNELSKLIVCTSAAHFDLNVIESKFRQFGGEVAAKAFKDYWTNPNDETKMIYAQQCTQYLGRRKIDEQYLFYNRLKLNSDILDYFFTVLIKEFDCRSSLKNITVPTLLLCGEDDPMAPKEIMLEIKKNIASEVVKFVTIEDVGHNLIWEDNNAFNAEIVDFIK